MRRRSFLGASVYTAGGLVVPAWVGGSVGLFVKPPTSDLTNPTITSLEMITGNLNHGSTIRIHGSGFGVKPQAAPRHYDPCTDYSDGDLATDNGYWVEILSGACAGTPLSTPPKFVDNASSGAPLMGPATTSLLTNYDHQRQAACMKKVSDVMSSPIGEAYVSYQLHQNLNKSNWHTSGDPIPNTKIYFIYADENWTGTGADLLGYNHNGTSNHTLMNVFGCPGNSQDPDDLGGTGSEMFTGNNNAWARQEGYKKESDPGSQNGKLYLRTDDRMQETKDSGGARDTGRPADGNETSHYGLPNSPSWQDSVFPNGVTTLGEGCDSNQIESWTWGVVDAPQQFCDDSTQGGRRNPDHRPTIYHVSEFYCDDTGARVEALPDSTAFEHFDDGEQIRLIQIPTAWSDTSIDFTINKSRQYDNDISAYYIAVWNYPNMYISNTVQLSDAT